MVEVRNRFKGLNLTDRVPDELWTEVCVIVHQDHPQEKEMQKGKCLSEKSLQISGKRREVKSNECRVPEDSKES